MKYSEAVKIAAKELNIPAHVALEAYRSMYKYIRQDIMSLGLDRGMERETYPYEGLRYRLPGLGILKTRYTRWRRYRKGVYKRLKRQSNYFKNGNNN